MSIRRSSDADAPRPGDGTTSERLRAAEGAAVVSRRGVLWRTGLATVAGAAALTALDEQRANAATGDPFTLGHTNTANVTTELSGTASPIMQLDGGSLGATGTTLVINGPPGGGALYVTGNNTGTTTGLAIHGQGAGAAIGVFGGSSSGTGVSGSSTSGTGVSGASSSGAAVQGTSTSGPGVSGASTSGTGVVASSSTGYALKVSGKAHFSRSGASSVLHGHSSKTVAVSGMTSSSLVLVTLQSSVSGVYLHAAVPATGKFTVYLSKTAPHTTKFAWFVLN